MKKRLSLKAKKKKFEEDVRKDLRKFIEKLERTDHYVPSPKDVLVMIRRQEAKAPKVACGNCGYKWAPNPYLWKDDPMNFKYSLQEDKNGELVRTIPCPKCGSLNKLDLDTLIWITQWWSQTKVINDVLKEETERARKKYGYCITATKGLKSDGERSTL